MIQAPRPELYDLEADTAEQRNVFAERRSAGAAMIAALDGLSRIRQAPEAPAALDRSAAERIASLGYVGRSAAVRDSNSEAADPKDYIRQFNTMTDLQIQNAPPFQWSCH